MAALFDRLRRSVSPAPPTGLPPWARPLFAAQLAPALTEGDTVRVWRIADDASAAQISDQFKANAGDYHARYAAADHFERLFRRAIDGAGVAVAERPLILDLGSGSGVNSIVPCRRLFPGAQAIATDLSGELLAMLAAYLRDTGGADEVVCVQMDAMADHVAPASVDLVTGASILHHLERPQDALAAAARALKPGGHAIFFEPFDGWCLARLAFERILAEADLRSDPLDPAAAQALRALCADIAARTRPDPASEAFRALDDKWLFSRDAMSGMAQDAGFAEVRIVPHNTRPDLYRMITPIQLRLATGRDDVRLPVWATDILAAFDEAVPDAVKHAAPLEASVVLTRAP